MIRDAIFDDEDFDRMQEAFGDDVDDVHLRAPSHGKR